jgi:hypothetical protein
MAPMQAEARQYPARDSPRRVRAPSTMMMPAQAVVTKQRLLAVLSVLLDSWSGRQRPGPERLTQS